MKTRIWIMSALLAVGVALGGCSKKSQVDTSKLGQSFQSSELKAQSSVNDAVSAIKSANYAGALAKLQQVASEAKLTPEQQQAIKDVIEQVKKVMAEAAGKAAEGASKAVGDLQKPLPQK